VYGQTRNVSGALQRLGEALLEPIEPYRNEAKDLPPVRGDIRFENIGFAYPGREAVLHNFDLHIQAGETVALTGKNGAGKSTLAHLLMRLMHPQQGRILIDGVDIEGVSLASLRSQIGVVQQHVLLFNGTVRDNIAWGQIGASDEQVQQAAQVAQAHEFINALPQGYDTVIGDQGVRLSGGQRQRIALARAMLKDPAILILDEATAMFDPQGEKDFIEQCRAALANRTVILITHRPASLALADHVVTFDRLKPKDAPQIDSH
jgi:ATP-binding cassette, subfamily B, bacterial